MRQNLPVTNREYVLLDNETIVSKTDLHGNITYVNDEFIRISGFSENELMGAPQNIVRHPDMPPEAFQDMWATIKSGKAWTGMVKNRCKNGDYYWVEATAAPLIENEEMVGYTSIRVKPSRNAVNATERIYRDIREGKSSLRIHEGEAIDTRHSLADKLASIPFMSRLSFYGLIAVLCQLLPLMLSSRPMAGVCSIVGVLAILFMGFDTLRSIIRPIDIVRHSLARMSGGDLSENIRASGSGEIRLLNQALKVFQTNVRLIIGQITQSTTHVADNSRVIRDGNRELSARTESQASFLEQTASSMEELTSTVRQNAENSVQAQKIVQTAATAAQHGGETVERFISVMGRIKSSSSKIEDIITVIDGIAFQTNILALNAAVEAARAGEQGRGFAVVASEVRNLAQRSATAAKEIKILIHDSVEQVDSGTKVVDAASEAMKQISASVRSASQIMNEISSASSEQSGGIAQVAQAITEMDAVTQQNSAMVEEATACADSLQNQVAALTGLVESFCLVATGRQRRALSN